MLDDYREICGDEALRRLIIHRDFDKKKLEDPQVLKSLAEVLEIDDIRQVEVWCREVEAEQKKAVDI